MFTDVFKSTGADTCKTNHRYITMRLAPCKHLEVTLVLLTQGGVGLRPNKLVIKTQISTFIIKQIILLTNFFTAESAQVLAHFPTNWMINQLILMYVH